MDFPQRQRPAPVTIDQLIEKKLAKPVQSR
jgi:hypothetical protein